MFHVAVLLEFQFSGNVTNIPGVLQPSATCQWFRLLTVWCRCLAHQPIVFCVVTPTRSPPDQRVFHWPWLSGQSLFFFSGCRPRFARLAASPLARACTPLTKPEEKERLLAVYPALYYLNAWNRLNESSLWGSCFEVVIWIFNSEFTG